MRLYFSQYAGIANLPPVYRDLVLMAQERDLSVSHTTVMQWAHEYASKLEKKIKQYIKKSRDFYKINIRLLIMRQCT